MSWDKILTGLWEASLSGSVILLTALVLRTLFQNRTPRQVFSLLWDIALVRLFLPCALSSPVSIWRWFPVSAEAPGQSLWPAVTSGAAPGQSLWPAVTSGTAPVGGTVIGDAVFRKNTVARIISPLDVDVILAAVWMAVALVLAARFLLNHWRSRRLYADSLPCKDTFVRDWQKTHSLYRRIQVRSSDHISAPLTYGILRPVLLLPAGMEGQDRAALSFVLEHEYQHILRFDTLRKGFLAAAACLHWFNPLVWVMYVLCNRDMELACDEAVTARIADRAGYARTLLDLEEQRGRLGLSGSHFSQNALEVRIKSIMKQKHISIAAMIAVAVVMSISVVTFASAAPDSEAGARPGKNAPQNGYADNHFQAEEGDPGSGTLAEAKTYIYYELTDATAFKAAAEPGSVQEFREVLTYSDDSAQSGTTGAAKELRAALEPYKVYGLVYVVEWNQHGELQLRMRWNGKPVHSLYDTRTGTWFANNMHGTELGDDAVDLATVYRAGQLCGLQESQPPHDVIHAAESAGSVPEKN